MKKVRTAIEVRYQETDQMGVVYHPNYLTWFEIGRTEWIRQKGLTYRQLEQQGLNLPVTDAEIKYLKPAKYDDRIVIYTRLAELSNVRVVFEVEIRLLAAEQQDDIPVWTKEPIGERLAFGSTRHAWLGADWKPVRLKREHPELYQLLLRDDDNV